MLKILLPLLMLFSVSSFAVMPIEAGFTSPDWDVNAEVVLINRNQSCGKVIDNRRMYNVTGAATQIKDLRPSIAQGGSSLKSVGLPNEVGWRSAEVI